MEAIALEAVPPAGKPDVEVRFELTVRDPDVVEEISKYQDGPDREAFALSALRLGVLALRQATGAVDAASLRQEGERVLGSVRELLSGASARLVSDLSSKLKHYFDPSDGELPQRLERLVRKDGDLEFLLRKHLQGDESTLAQTLARHIGEKSPLLRLLSPK